MQIVQGNSNTKTTIKIVLLGMWDGSEWVTAFAAKDDGLNLVFKTHMVKEESRLS